MFYTISLLVFIPIPFHKSVYILRGSIGFTPNHSWAKNFAVKGLGAEGEIFTLYNGKGMQRLCEKKHKKLTFSGWEQIKLTENSECCREGK